MRKPEVIPTIAIAFLLVVPCVAFASGKDKTGSGQTPTESMGLNYGKVEWTYTKQKPDGKASGNVAAKWSITQGAAARTTNGSGNVHPSRGSSSGHDQ